MACRDLATGPPGKSPKIPLYIILFHPDGFICLFAMVSAFFFFCLFVFIVARKFPQISGDTWLSVSVKK